MLNISTEYFKCKITHSGCAFHQKEKFIFFLSFFFFHSFSVVFLSFSPSLLSLACALLLPSFALGMCSCAVSSCQTLFCFTPLAPSFTDTSHFHIYGFSLSFTFIHLSVSLRPAAFPSPASYLPFSRLSELPISLHLPPPLCLSRVDSLTPLISFSPLPAVSTSYSCLSSFCTYLPPLLLSNCLHLHALLVSYLILYAAIRNVLLCLDHL